MRSGIDRAQNTHHALELISDAADQGARFIATPEMTTAVDKDPARLSASLPRGIDPPEIAAFAKMAADKAVWILLGSAAVKLADFAKGGPPAIANRAYLFSPTGEIAARYDKIHMFDVQLPGGETWRESAVYAPGDRAIVVEAPFAKIGLSICYDLRFPHLYRGLAQAGATLLCAPAAFTRQTGQAHWHTLLKARAIECGAFVMAPAQGGRHEDGRETYGHSLIIGPWGDVLAELNHDDPGVVLAEIDPAKALEARQRIPALGLEQSYEVSTIRS